MRCGARRRRRRSSPLLTHFAIQTAAWGSVALAICAAAWHSLALRDLAGAVRLDRFIWFNIGLDAGYVAVGGTLAIVGWKLARTLGLVGAGIGVAVQGTALFLLDSSSRLPLRAASFPPRAEARFALLVAPAC